MRGPLIASTLSLMIVIFATHNASAQYFRRCIEPVAPHCVDQVYAFDDDYAFTRCRNEVESFVDDTNEYLRCLSRNADEANIEAEQVIDRFNCRAQGRTYCP